MSHYIVEIDKLAKRPYGIKVPQLAGVLFGGINSSNLRKDRPDLNIVYGCSSPRKTEKIIESMISRSSSDTPFTAGIIFDKEPKIERVLGIAIVSKQVRIIERARNGEPNKEVGLIVDTSTVVLFDKDYDEMRAACGSVIDRFELARPVAVEPDTSAPEVQKVLQDVYGPGTLGKFAVALNGRAVDATAFGATI